MECQLDLEGKSEEVRPVCVVGVPIDAAEERWNTVWKCAQWQDCTVIKKPQNCRRRAGPRGTTKWIYEWNDEDFGGGELTANLEAGGKLRCESIYLRLHAAQRPPLFSRR